MEDLFESIESLPERVQEILRDFSGEQTYEDCEKLLSLCEAEGYTFEYYLDANPFNLTKIKSDGEPTLL
jgi:hypothetical protein